MQLNHTKLATKVYYTNEWEIYGKRDPLKLDPLSKA